MEIYRRLTKYIQYINFNKFQMKKLLHQPKSNRQYYALITGSSTLHYYQYYQNKQILYIPPADVNFYQILTAIPMAPSFNYGKFFNQM